jgi:hypothetical protein
MRCFSRSATRHTDTPHGVVFDTQFRRYRGRNNQVEPLPIGAIAARGTLPTHTSPSSGAIAARQRAARCAPADRWRWRWHVLVAAHEHVVLRLKPPFSNALFAFFQPFLTLFPHTPTPLLYAHTSRSTHPGGWGRGRRRRVGEARFATAGFAIAVSRPLVSRPLLIRDRWLFLPDFVSPTGGIAQVMVALALETSCLDRPSSLEAYGAGARRGCAQLAKGNAAR